MMAKFKFFCLDSNKLQRFPEKRLHEGCAFARSDIQLVKRHEEQECRLKPVTCKICKEAIALSQLYNHRVTIHEKTPLQTNLGDYEPVGYCLKFPVSISGHWIECLHVADSDFKFVLNLKTQEV